MFIDLST